MKWQCKPFWLMLRVEYLTRIEDGVRIEGPLDPSHDLDLSLTEKRFQILLLHETDAVFARYDTSTINGISVDLIPHSFVAGFPFCLIEMLGVVSLEPDLRYVRVEIAVRRVSVCGLLVIIFV